MFLTCAALLLLVSIGHSVFPWLQHGIDYTEEIPPLTLSGSKAAASLTVSERWLQQLERLHHAKASTNSQAPIKSAFVHHAASGDAVLNWLCESDPILPCTNTLPGKLLAERPAS